jgi:predicted 2-oxoglutarate/Fe(II)-dependent dioxygenase YbiX
MALPDCEITRYNIVLADPTVRAALRHFARMDSRFRSADFIREVARAVRFPSITVAELLGAARAAGVSVRGAHATLDELQTLGPFLAYLKRSPDPLSSADLVRIEKLRARTAIVSHDRFGEETISRELLAKRWSGVVLLKGDDEDDWHVVSELDRYRDQISVLPDFVTPAECAELIDYCERASFRRSRVINRRGGLVTDVMSLRARSSSSVVLPDRSFPALARLYRRCAEIENLPESNIETIQCVRYRRGQRFRAHFDGGVDLPRLTTFLLYLNDDFAGGETYFPMLDKAVAPKAGSCLRFPSCTSDGRVIWQSEHGGLPVSRGAKYALNIWVRCAPRPGAGHRMEPLPQA